MLHYHVYISKVVVGCFWLYTVKVGLDGKIDRSTARLVAKVLYLDFLVSLL
jgi:hypothetical protein